MTRKIILTIAFSLVLALSTTIAGQKMMSVQNKKGEIRSSPSPLGNVVATVNYGDRVTVIEEQGKWIKVSTADGFSTGWMDSSALTKKVIKMNAGDKNAEVAASSGEMALAGKGFNSQVEAEFKSKNKDIDFTWVDRMEKIKITVSEIRKFLESGGLKAGKGGA